MHSEGRTHIQQYACSVQAATQTHTQSTHRHGKAHTHRHTEHIVFCSPSPQSAEQLQTQNALFHSFSSLLLCSLQQRLIASPPVSLCPPLLPFFISSACQLSSLVKRRSTPTHLSFFFYCFVKWREREGADNNGRVGWDEIEEKHKYRQQTLITQARFDSRHKPSTSCKCKTDRKLDFRQLFLFSHFGPFFKLFWLIKTAKFLINASVKHEPLGNRVGWLICMSHEHKQIGQAFMKLLMYAVLFTLSIYVH